VKFDINKIQIQLTDLSQQLQKEREDQAPAPSQNQTAWEEYRMHNSDGFNKPRYDSANRPE